ncbi:Protein kinase domain [Macleaya cordata]|uniref:Protein kinase domain n=1 Tax=Macleaya cordata TaxID=56857 RepID=A0A200R277_MACCD|nr:Protein kinase domain [Macleaya cordata]
MAFNLDAKFPNLLSEELLVSATSAPISTPTTSQTPPPNLPLFRRRHHKHFLPRGSPSHTPVPAHPPGYGSLTTSGHPPSNSRLSKPSMKRSHLPAPSNGLLPPRLAAVAPTPSSAGIIPSGLAQPPLSPHISDCCEPDMVLKQGSTVCHCVYPIKLDLLLVNVSLSSNWSPFLEELASQLRLRVSQFEIINFYVLSLSNLNISMDVTPHTGISFSANDMDAINSSLAMHRIRLNPTLVGDYKLLSLTWFRRRAPSHAPFPATSPLAAPPDLFSPSTSISASKGKNSNFLPILGTGAGILIIIIICALVIYSCTSDLVKKNVPIKETVKPRTADATPAGGSLAHPTSTQFFSYKELKEATNNFEAASVLGEGGFGKVFKGVLTDGTAVAIKKLTNGGQQGDREFLVEVQMLSRLHHRNLVKLVGYYSSRESSQNLLCYELVPNGTLEAWLHGPSGINCPLDWDTRMKIALDAARGLAYLHEDSQPCVIHRDFKASNILLENNFHAKVADFGLAKLAPEGQANYLSTRVMGTFGYVAPEYAMTGHLLVKSDVYSYGVVLLELLTGKTPVDMSQSAGQENLVTWARPILRDKDRLEELADPRLGCKYPKEDFLRVCTIAAACVAPEASQRPTMGEVVQSLKMVQRITEYQDSMLTTSNTHPNLGQSSTNYETDRNSSMFSSGPFPGLNTFDHDNIFRTAVFSEDLHEGR